MSQLSGNLITIDLKHAQEVFKAVPWVRTAEIRRDFPRRLRVVVQEHEPMAMWGDEGGNQMVNQQDQLFEADVIDTDVDALPRLKGPVSQASVVAQMYRNLLPVFQGAGMGLSQLELSARGNWRATTNSGAVLELGRGQFDDISENLERFLITLPLIAARYERSASALLGADLRHKNAYALQLRGVGLVGQESKLRQTTQLEQRMKRIR
jgi:cell division protein FtsQ